MIVADASALVELLRASSAGTAVVERIDADRGNVHFPHLAVSEAASALRSMAARRELGEGHAGALVAELAVLPGTRHPAEGLLGRAWELRRNLTMYDAHYIALAEVLGAPLITCDGRLARSSGHAATVEFIDVGG